MLKWFTNTHIDDVGAIKAMATRDLVQDDPKKIGSESVQELKRLGIVGLYEEVDENE